VFVDFYNFF